MVTSATVGTSPSLFQNLGYDPRKDFAPIGLIAGTPNLIVVHPSFPARSLAELVKIGKETTAPIPYGSPGTGTLNHLTVELLGYRTGKYVETPVEGGQPTKDFQEVDKLGEPHIVLQVYLKYGPDG